jgi:hypothetical protein
VDLRVLAMKSLKERLLGVIEWMGEKEIVKQFKRPLVGR